MDANVGDSSIITLTDEQALEKFLETKDHSFFQMLVERHGDAILKFVRRKYLSGDQGHAEDIVQQTFLKLLERPEMFDRRYKLRPWLFTIAANAAIDTRRYLDIRPDLHADFNPEDLKATQPSDNVEVSQDVPTMLDTLDPQDRMCVEVVFYKGLTMIEGAKLLDMPEGTFKSRFRRALTKMGRAA